MTWTVYILQCFDGTLYTGSTNDLTNRLKKHNAGKGAKYTKGRLPVEVRYAKAYPNRSAAQKAEAAIKKLSRVEKLVKIAEKG